MRWLSDGNRWMAGFLHAGRWPWRVMKGFFPRKNRLLSREEEHLELQRNIGDKRKRLVKCLTRLLTSLINKAVVSK